MFRCPHCKNLGVSALSKLISAPWAPAQCNHCGGKSSEPIKPTQTLRGISFIAVVGATWASFVYASWILLLICILVLTLAFIGIQILVPLEPLSGSDVEEGKSRRTLQVALLLFVGFLMAGLGFLL